MDFHVLVLFKLFSAGMAAVLAIGRVVRLLLNQPSMRRQQRSLCRACSTNNSTAVELVFRGFLSHMPHIHCKVSNGLWIAESGKGTKRRTVSSANCSALRSMGRGRMA